MNNEEINRAIAEHLGWKWFDHPDTRERTKTFTLSDKWVLNPAGELVFPHSVPNYCGDLNAMREAEQATWTRDEGLEAFAENLAVAVFGECPDALLRYSDAARLVHATSRQRAEAFLRTVGKWRGEE